MSRVARALLFAVLSLCSIALTSVLVQDWLRVSYSSDAQLLSRFRGAAFEDVFGFGFWFSWTGIAALELLLLSTAWTIARRQPYRYVAVVLVFAFAIASLANYQSFSREQQLWSSRSSS
jgi:ABC-type Mn2+/Zn2+ transport system permease subunit